MSKLSIEDLFVSALGSARKLHWYLRYNINLVNHLEQEWPTWMATMDIAFSLVPRLQRKKMFDGMDVERLLNILEKERPDLYKIINTEKNKVWMGHQIENFKERFL